MQGKISRARIFSDRAAITRTVVVDPPVREISFSDIPHDADAATLRAHATLGKTRVKTTGLALSSARNDKSEPLRATSNELEKTRARLGELDDEDSSAAREGELIRKYSELAATNISKQLAAPENESWTKIFDELRAKNRTLATARVHRQRERAILQKREAELLEEHQALAHRDRAGNVVTVSLDLPPNATGRLEVELTYVSSRAEWTPSYDVRHFAAAGDQREKIEITAIAMVRQSTGEDWDDVELIASMLQPAPSEPPPELSPILVVSAQGIEKVISKKNGVTRAELAPSVEYRAQKKISVPSTDLPIRVELFSVDIPCRTRLEVAPRERPIAVLVADVENRSGRALLAGRVNVFRGSTYVGQAELASTGAHERIRIPLGVERSLRVGRELKAHAEKRAALIGTTTWIFESRTTLENVGSTPAEVVVRDRVPVPASDDTTVRITEIDRAMEVDARSGQASLVVSVAPHAKREVAIGYKITAPRGQRFQSPPAT